MFFYVCIFIVYFKGCLYIVNSSHLSNIEIEDFLLFVCLGFPSLLLLPSFSSLSSPPPFFIPDRLLLQPRLALH